MLLFPVLKNNYNILTYFIGQLKYKKKNEYFIGQTKNEGPYGRAYIYKLAY